VPSEANTIVSSIRDEGTHLNFIIGPRQVGKTTGIKIAVSKLLNKIEARRIFYYRCDLISDYKELLEVIQSYLRLTQAWDIKESKVMFLDEVNMVKEWWRTIKHLIDTGVFQNVNIFLTGSSSIKLLKETERFPGRRGLGKDIFFLPLSFKGYLQIANRKLYSEIEHTLIKVKARNLSEALDTCLLLQPYLHELNRVFLEYIECGGYPLSILERFGEEKGASESLLASIRYDVERAGRNIGVFKDVSKYLLQAVPSPISLDKIAREAGVSKATCQEYIQLAVDLFLLIALRYIDPYRLQPVPRKERKYCFIDPFIYTVFSEWCDVTVKKEHVVEAAAIAHILRLIDWRKVYENTVYYWWRNRAEVDLIVKVDGKPLGFEITWSPFKETVSAVGKIKKIVLLDREELDLNKRRIPLVLFLLVAELKNIKFN